MYSYERENRINETKLKRLTDWYEGKEAPPVQLDAEVHRRCNLNCIACPRQANDFDLNKDSRDKELGKKRWLDIVRQAGDLGVKKFNLEGGGEPTAAPELIYPVMEEIKKQGMYGIITTNGTLLNEDRIKWMVDIDWDRIHFSLDSPEADLHDFLRDKKGAFGKTVENIKLLNKWKSKRNKENPMLSINIVINNRNYDKLPEMVELANELGADYLFAEPLMVFCEAGKKLKINDESEKKRLEEAKKRAKNLAERYNIDNNFATEDRNLQENIVESTSEMEPVLSEVSGEKHESILSSPCLKPWRLMSVKYDGKVGHCGLIKHGVSIEKKSLKEIWYGERLADIREKMKGGELLEHCDNCVPSDVTQRKRFRKDLESYLS